MFLTSHDPADIEHLCRRAVVIDRGTIMLDTPVEKLINDYPDIQMEDIIASIFRNKPDSKVIS